MLSQPSLRQCSLLLFRFRKKEDAQSFGQEEHIRIGERLHLVPLSDLREVPAMVKDPDLTEQHMQKTGAIFSDRTTHESGANVSQLREGIIEAA